MKLRDSHIALPADGQWLLARLRHSPAVLGLAIVIGADDTHEPAEAPGLIDALHHHGFASLLLDLLTEAEAERDPDAPFNIPLLATRVLAAAEWAAHQPDLRQLPLFLIARGTGCGAAVRAASRAPDIFRAIVCLGGRLDLAGAEPLARLVAPTRIIVAEDDPDLPIIQRAQAELPAAHDLQRLPASVATDHAATLALEWIAHWRDVEASPEDEPS
ncbi:MAG: alpha/beta hydrolase [Pseudazoarcus pumilus]|nr:alpha/beta hydrolase [Pseudazoarcus pumilus]